MRHVNPDTRMSGMGKLFDVVGGRGEVSFVVRYRRCSEGSFVVRGVWRRISWKVPGRATGRGHAGSALGYRWRSAWVALRRSCLFMVVRSLDRLLEEVGDLESDDLRWVGMAE